METVTGAVVVVTGAGRGIGRAIAEELGRAGARVVLNYSQSKEQAESLATRLKDEGAQDAIAVQADVSDRMQAANLINETVRRFDRLDVLVNNAGITIDRTLRNHNFDESQQAPQTKLHEY